MQHNNRFAKTNVLKTYCLLALTFLAVLHTQAKSYYFSSSSGNDSYSTSQAQNQATPWKSISKLNSIFSTLVAGDVIYFKRGDTFYGSITVNKSGSSSSSPILLTAYGSGNRPVISGFTTVTSWTSIGSGKYQATVSGASTTLNMVTINNTAQRMGRYPNYNATGDSYLYYESFGGNGSSITDNQLSTSTNWKGADVVVKKRRWVLDKAKITNHSGGTLSFTNPSSYPGLAGFGYFIQNDARTLDQYGEWYLNPSSKVLQVYFGSVSPSSSTVKVSTVDNLINIGNYKYITVKELAFEGGNQNGLIAQNGTNTTIQNCDFNYMGGDGIYILNSPNALLENVTVKNVMNNGVNLGNQYVGNSTVRNCTISDCGMFQGMGDSGDGAYRGLVVNVNSGSTIEYNTIQNIGYNALEFQGSNVTIKNNLINNYCMVKDDGGGIYTWANSGKTNYTNRKIQGNIIMNAKGDPYGTSGKTAEAKGIYLDGGSMNVEISGNSIAYMARTGMLLNNAVGVKIRSNTVYDARFGIELVRLTDAAQVRNIEMKQNILYPKTASQSALYYKNMYLNLPSAMSIQSDMQQIGNVDSNYYNTPSSIGFGYFYSLNYSTIGTIITPAPLSLEGWQSFMNKDKKSKRPSKSTTNMNDLRFEYNASTSDKTITLDAKYVGVDGTSYNGSITLKPYTAQVLVKDGASTAPPPSSSSLASNASVSAINCFGGSATATVTGTGGTAPYSGTGSFGVTAGTGSLKLSVNNPVANSYTLLYSSIGSVTNTKTYVVRLSTIGSNSSGVIKVGLRQTKKPFATISSSQSKSFGTSRVDHEFIIAAPTTESDASFIIQVAQASGTVYIDNIAVFQATSAGALIGNNLYSASNGQFENNLNNIYIWSNTNNHSASIDKSGKITNTHYFSVKDSKGAISVAAAKTYQPGAALKATATAGIISVVGGVTSIVVNATGGTAPYTGTGSFSNKKIGTYTYTVKDAKGCTASTTITLSLTGNRTSDESVSEETLLAAPATTLLETKQMAISSYPNPTTTEFNLLVEGGTQEAVTVSVMSIDGRVVYGTQGTSNKRYTFGNEFMTGMYIIQVLQGKSVQTLKVIKAK